MKKKTDISEKQYQVLDKTVMNKKRENSDLVYKNFNFNKFNITGEEFKKFPAHTKYKHLQMFFSKINELINELGSRLKK